MSDDFKTKYSEKAKEFNDDYTHYYDIGFNDGHQCGYDNLFPLINDMRDALEDGLRNFACDWYMQQMGKDETPKGFTTGIAAKIHNRDTALRFKIALDKQRQALKSLDDFVGVGNDS